MKDLSIIALSVVVAVIMVETGALKSLLVSTQEIKFIGSFIAGIFFVSIFSAAPATVAFAEIAQFNSVFWVAFFGGIGALVGDLIIFRFIKNRLAEDFSRLIRKMKSERLAAIFKLKLFKWLVPFLGALVIASPLPDEIGIMMMGFSNMRISLFMPISFILNFLGILAIGFIAKTIF
ncbi:MAG: hypothetical protein A2909_02335 [Candidatus Tagabacteria bacterium RIFCSPLOWO2_01_FULL_39_11]|uniref:TVP38/TMEM64 family membrane protein n=1 Tax=Candidatus Tagabacteria bacterium RIFCSPLOWO2_01_FULL_39_11 TaxID=1802295 RepID=A0A1G2LPI2_9BACT|nr:MAG: hypothetical protein A2909_02335 [Candidatus Tagabacteria bacterium RIFCSPLOWO2_01_FULL_39_11]